ncbi:hypothetical protein [Runella sp.]|uniref:hypothetical protein n=1 Tax=Runella sp. TaxID=1960881 RepID=UPI003D14538B
MIYNPNEDYDDASSGEIDDAETGQSDYTDELLGDDVTDEEAKANTPNQYKATVDSDND